MKFSEIEVKKVKLNKDNPRVIKDENFKKLVESVKKFPEMLKIRPIVLNRDYVIIGGNQRFKACVEAGFKKVPFYYADELTPEQEKEFMIKDNVQSGQWDFDLLEDYETDLLKDWGFDFQDKNDEKEEIYSRKIVSPVYEIIGEKPDLSELFNDTKTKALIEEIDKSSLPVKMKKFLKIASYRHTVFNFEKIAEFYASESKEVQDLFEKNALVIIDFNQAIEKGFIELNESLADQYFSENEE
jgi:hypothetical protein